MASISTFKIEKKKFDIDKYFGKLNGVKIP